MHVLGPHFLPQGRKASAVHASFTAHVACFFFFCFFLEGGLGGCCLCFFFCLFALRLESFLFGLPFLSPNVVLLFARMWRDDSRERLSRASARGSRPKHFDRSRSRSDSRRFRNASRPKAAAKHTAAPRTPVKSADDMNQEQIEEILGTMRMCCDQIEDHSDRLSASAALRLLKDTVASLIKELDPESKSPRVASPSKGRTVYTPRYDRGQVNLAQKHVQQCLKSITDAFQNTAQGKATGAATQLCLTFDQPVKSPKDVALRVQDLFNGSPKVEVEWLVEEEGKVWKRPPASTWFAEKGGDSRKVVFRLHVPARASFRKVSKMSLQYTVESKVLTIQSTRQNLVDFVAPIIAKFGPVGNASPINVAAVDIDIMKYLPRG